jgi:hypothetical protein
MINERGSCSDMLDNEAMVEVLCSGDASREERSDACEVVEW